MPIDPISRLFSALRRLAIVTLLCGMLGVEFMLIGVAHWPGGSTSAGRASTTSPWR